MNNKPKALVIGSNGTIGQALTKQLLLTHDVTSLSRNVINYSEHEIEKKAHDFTLEGNFSLIICCIGVLHDEQVSPEKSLKNISAEKLAHYFYVNTILPMLCLKHFSCLLEKNQPSVFVCLSAMVGSTRDNRLGGWYGYRSSKAALNSLIKTTSIELARSNKQAVIVAIHPGTTMGELSKPFTKNINPKKYYTPNQTAKRIISVVSNLQPSDSGSFINWDGTYLPW